MSKWMCDVKGTDPVAETVIGKVFTELDSISGDNVHQELISKIDSFIMDRGALPQNVQTYIKQLGHQWTDSGGGLNSWHLGVPFDDLLEATNYLNKMSIKFQAAIAAGLLRFELKSWTKTSWK